MKRVKMVVLIGLAALGAVYAGTRPEDMTKEEKNKLLVKVALQSINAGDLEMMAKLYSTRFIQHQPGEQKTISWQEFQQGCREVRQKLPNTRIEIEDIIAESDKVAVRLTTVVTYNKKYRNGTRGSAEVEFREMDLFRIEGGRIVEEWVECNLEDWRPKLRQAGIVSQSAQKVAEDYMKQMDYIEDFTDALIKEMDKRPPRR